MPARSNSINEVPAVGTKEERKTFTEVVGHYEMSRQDLDTRIVDFDKKDILFRSYIQENAWPYKATMFDPRTFTALYEKTSRLVGRKPKGRLVPREGGDALGAKINNELLSWQWDDNERADGQTMLAKWALMDLNARKYGASFGICKWKYERKYDSDAKKSYPHFDGPDFEVLSNRDVLANPSYATIKNWCQVRSYPTLQSLQQTNDAARSKPIYKNLDILQRVLREDAQVGGDQRSTNYVVKDKSIKGLQDFLGRDEVYRTVEVVTEYRCDRWITFAPKHGVILRDIPNPYKHGQIPVIQLKYYPIDQDLYGLSEIEPVEKIQKAINALLSQYIDAVNLTTYPIIKVKSTGGAVQMHTLNFGAGAKWMMQDPTNDVVAGNFTPQGVREFPTTYRLLVGAMQEALGETSQGISGIDPGADDKTATEVRDTALQRSARDNFNQQFLGDALKKQMMFWFSMNQQFLFSNPQERIKIIRITGKDAIKYFQNVGLDGEGLTDRSIDMLSDENTPTDINISDFTEPLYPVSAAGVTVPKLTMEDDMQTGALILEPEDLSGNYDYIADIESMRIPDEAQILQASKNMVETALNPAATQMLAQEGYKLKVKDLLEDFFEQLGKKDADKYFEKIQPQLPVPAMQNGQPIQGGAGSAAPVPVNSGNGAVGGVPAGIQAVPNGQAQPVVS